MTQVFYCAEDGTVIHWDVNNPPIKIGLDGSGGHPGSTGGRTIKFGGQAVPRTGGCPQSLIDCPDPDEVHPEYSRGYKNAVKDVLNEIARSGKQNLTQWLEARLKELS